PDPLVEGINRFPPGTYFWRVRAVHGDVVGPWSAGATFTVAPLPPTPPALAVFHIINEPGSVSGGNSTQARVALNMPAPAAPGPARRAASRRHARSDGLAARPDAGAPRPDRERPRRLRPRVAGQLPRPVFEPRAGAAQQPEGARWGRRPREGSARETAATGPP